jgi:hypothetical protein
MIVVKDFVVSRPILSGNRAEFYVEYIQLGKLNYSDGKFTHLPPLKVRAAFTVVLMDEHSAHQSDKVGEPKWRIEGSAPEPHITVASALKYVTELRDKTKDVLTRKKAEKTIAVLQNLGGREN